MHTVVIVLTGVTGAMMTYYVNEHLRQGAVRASALLSLVVGIIFYVIRGKIPAYYVENIPVAFTGASFVGMVSSKALSKIRLVGFAGFIFALIYLNASHFFKGYGGALGTSASIAIMATMCIPVFIPRRKTLNGLIILRHMIYRNKGRKERSKKIFDKR